MACDLEQLERLHAAATPGPWITTGDGRVMDGKMYKCIAACRKPVAISLNELQRARDDSFYITAACNAVPELIAELKAARAEKAAFKSWQTGTPSASGFYWVKYKSGAVDVIELEFRRMQWAGCEPRTYLGLAGHIMRPFEDEEDIVAWAGPLPMPETKEAGE